MMNLFRSFSLKFLLFTISVSLNAQSGAFKEVFDKYYGFYQQKDFWNAAEWSEKLVIEAGKEFGEGSMLQYNTILYAAEANYESRKYDKAAIYYNKALDHVLKNGKINDDALQYMNKLSLIYAYTGEYASSKLFAERTLNEYVKLHGDKNMDYPVALSNVAETYAQMELLEKAIELNRMAYEKASKIDPKAGQTILIKNNLATTLVRNKKTEEAITHFQELVDMCGLIYGKDHYVTLNFKEQLAVSLQNLNKYAEAIEMHQNCKHIFERLNLIEDVAYNMILNNLAHCYYETDKAEEAVKLLKQSYGFFKKKYGVDHPETFLLRFNLGYTMLKTKQASEGFEMLSEAMQYKLRHLEDNFYAWSETERIASKTSVDELIQQYLKVAVGYGKFDNPQEFEPKVAETIYDFHLTSKGQVLKSVLKTKKKILNSGDPKLIANFHEWESLKNKMAHYSRMTADEARNIGVNKERIREVLDEKEKELAVKAKNLNLSFENKQFKAADVRKELKPGEAAIEIIRMKDEKSVVSYLVLILTQTEILPVLMPKGNELEKKFYAYYKNSIELNKTDELSFKAFWKPIQDRLPATVKKIYFSTDGVFSLINVGTLFDTDSKKYVEERFDIIQLTSTKDLIANNPLNLSSEVILIGNPDFESEPNNKGTKKEIDIFEQKRANGTAKMIFEKLPGTEVEVKNIQNLTKNSYSTKVFLASKAIEENVKSVNNPKILHFATHGYFEKTETNNPTVAMLNSGLVFSGVTKFYNANQKPATEDGFLSAYEAQNLNLDGTELVILSACETGLGMNVESEGVFGLQRAFFVAGCKNIIMSLWKVNDQTTQELMTVFYEEYVKTKNVKTSFATAKKTIREKYVNPKYWGAFVMLGK